MLISMTGFSSKIIELPFNGTILHATITLKSLNARFFEASCKIPYALNYLETDLIKLFKSSLVRGNIFFSVYLSQPSALKTPVTVSLSMVQNYINALENIKNTFNISGTLSISDIVHLPHIFENTEQIISTSTAHELIKQVKELMQELMYMRIKEGAALQKDIETCLTKMHKYLMELEPRATFVLARKKEEFIQQFTLAQTAPDEKAKESFFALIGQQLDKLDIHEELSRLKTHLESFDTTLKNAESEKGKKLDFIAQEAFREINTIMSKSSDTEIGTLGIGLKVELEKIREQIQNVV